MEKRIILQRCFFCNNAEENHIKRGYAWNCIMKNVCSWAYYFSNFKILYTLPNNSESSTGKKRFISISQNFTFGTHDLKETIWQKTNNDGATSMTPHMKALASIYSPSNQSPKSPTALTICSASATAYHQYFILISKPLLRWAFPFHVFLCFLLKFIALHVIFF